MKRKAVMMKISAMVLTLGAVLLLPGAKAWAAETYTVTFRPGNVGAFAVSSQAQGSAKEKAQEVAALNYAGYETEVTQRGAIKVTVPAGSPAPAAPSQIVAEEGYFVKDASSWGPSGEPVDRNVDYVADYGKLVDGVEYTVEYVDDSSGESIAPVYIAQANKGESRKVTAPARIVISGGAAYNLVSDGTLEKELAADAAKNVFTFRYTLETGRTIEEERVTYTDGGTVTVTETVTRVVDNGQTMTEGTGTTGAPAVAGPAADAEEEEADTQQVEIPEEDTPLASGIPEEEEDGILTIEEEETPLAAGIKSEENGNPAVMAAAAITVVLAAGSGCLWLIVRKKRKTKAEQ